MVIVRAALAYLKTEIGKTGENNILARGLGSDGARLHELTARYFELDMNERLAVVQMHEDVAIEALEALFGTENTRTMMIT